MAEVDVVPRETRGAEGEVAAAGGHSQWSGNRDGANAAQWNIPVDRDGAGKAR